MGLFDVMNTPGVEPEQNEYLKRQQMLGLAAAILQASAPSTDPRSGNMGYALGKGIEGMNQGRQGGIDTLAASEKFKALIEAKKRQKTLDDALKGVSTSKSVQDPLTGAMQTQPRTLQETLPEYSSALIGAGDIKGGVDMAEAISKLAKSNSFKFPTATITKDGPDGKPHIYAQDPTTGDFTRDQGAIGDKSFKYTGASVFRGEDDNWWRWNPSSGDPEYHGRTASGKYGWINDPNKSVPDAIPKEKGRTPAGLMDKGVQIDTIRGNIARVRETKKDAWIGPVAGRAYRVKEALTGLKDDNQSMFYADVNDLGDMLLRARSGAQINEQEYARLRKLVPTPDLPPKPFNERLDRFETQLMQILENQEKRLGAGRYLVPSTQNAPKPPAKGPQNKLTFNPKTGRFE